MPIDDPPIKQRRTDRLLKTTQQAEMAATMLIFQRTRRKRGGIEQEWVLKSDLSEEGFKYSSINSFIDKLRKKKVLKLLCNRTGMVKAMKFNLIGEEITEEELKELYQILEKLFSSTLK